MVLSMLLVRVCSPQAFEVVSVKQAPAVWPTPMRRSAGHVLWESPNRLELVLYAFHRQRFQVEGLQYDDSAFRIEAVTQNDASDEAVRKMMQKMLEDRFGLQFHETTRELRGFALTAGPRGTKLKRAGDSLEPPLVFGKPLPVGKMFNLSEHGQTVLVGRKVTLGQFCAALALAVNAPILDETDLVGDFDVDLAYVADATQPTKGQVEGPPLSVAVPEQLGLRLTSRKVATTVMVIDRILRNPTDN